MLNKVKLKLKIIIYIIKGVKIIVIYKLISDLLITN